MTLCVASSNQCEAPYGGGDSVDCACDGEGLRAVRAYLHERFADRAVREFHSHSTVVVDGSLPAPYADYHVVSVSDERPYCAVLTSRFLEQPVGELREHLRRWDLASAMQMERTVIVDGDGVSGL